MNSSKKKSNKKSKTIKTNKNECGASCQDGGMCRHGSPLCTITSKLYLKLEQTSLRTIINRAEWKSDKYRIKETTSIQTGTGWSLIHMWWIRIWEEYLWSEEPQPHTRPPSPRFQCPDYNSKQLLVAKPSRD